MSFLLTSFVEKPLRETSGSRSANRFDYQKNWALCELLSLHSTKNDYLIVFDYHEDVVVFDSQMAPSSVTFYQVKTKDRGNWTIGSLTKSQNNESSQSIISKLYSNYSKFLNYVDILVFASNQGLSAQLKNGDKSFDCKNIKFAQLSPLDKEKVRIAAEGIDQDHCDIFGLSKITVLKTDLHLENHVAITKGKLVEFFERLHPESPVHISLVYKTIFDEIRRKTNYEEGCTNVEELLSRKSISHAEFERIIKIVLQNRTSNDLWLEAQQQLTTSYGPLEIRKIKSDWQQYAVDRMDVGNEFLMRIRESICSSILELELSGLNDTLKFLIEKILDRLKLDCEIDYYHESYIKAAILYEVINNDPISKVSTESAEETK